MDLKQLPRRRAVATVSALVLLALITLILVDAKVLDDSGQPILTPDQTRLGQPHTEVSISIPPGLPLAGVTREQRAAASSRPAPLGPDTDPETFYVSPEFGDDNGDGQAQESPWRSLQASLDRLQPGQTLYLMDGVYNELAEPVTHYIVRVNGLPDEWIHITAAPGHQPVIRPSQGEGMAIRADYIEVSGLTIEGQDFSVDRPYGFGLVAVDSHHVRLISNTVSNMPISGISAIESTNIEIYNNEVFDNSFWGTEQGSGISIWHAKDHGTSPSSDGYHDKIIGNITYRNENKVFSRWEPGKNIISDGNGIIIDASKDLNYSGRTLVANNVAFDNGGRGIHVYLSARVDVAHNTTFHNGQTDTLQLGPVELTANRSFDVRIFNNLAWPRPGHPAMQVDRSEQVTMGGNVFVTDSPSGLATSFDLVTSQNPGLTSSTVDPALADFRPGPTSLLLDRAVAFDPVVGTDATGQQRSAGAADVGAYEFFDIGR